MEDATHIAIVGGGVGGLTLASYIQRWASPAVHVTVFERRLGCDEHAGGTLLLQGEGIEVLHDLGLYGRLRTDAGHVGAAAEICSQLVDMGFDASMVAQAVSAAGGDLDQALSMLTSDESLPELARAAGATADTHVLRDSLMLMLLAGLGGNVKLQVNSEVVAVREVDDGVQLDFKPIMRLEGDRWVRESDSGVVETASFSLVVGADGNAPSSQVLKGVLGCDMSRAEALPILALQALVPLSAAGLMDASSIGRGDGQPGEGGGMQSELLVQKRLRGNVTVGRLDVGTAVGRLPTAEGAELVFGQWRFCSVLVHFRDAMARFPQPPEWAAMMMQHIASSTDPALRSTASTLVEQAAGGADGARLHAWVPFQKPSVERWSSQSGRLVVMGDAAHLVPPTRGWGANFAMGDAKCLAAALEPCLQAPPLSLELLREQLAQYEGARREAVSAGASDSVEAARQLISGTASRP